MEHHSKLLQILQVPENAAQVHPAIKACTQHGPSLCNQVTATKTLRRSLSLASET